MEQDKTKVTDDAFDMYQPFVTNEQKFKYWEESKAEIKRLNAASQHYERENTQLSAQVNKLREALEASDDLLRKLPNSGGFYGLAIMENNQLVLSATPAESLQAFENEVLERAAKAIDEMVVVYTKNCDRYKALGDEESTERNVNKGRAAISCAEVIRALKG